MEIIREPQEVNLNWTESEFLDKNDYFYKWFAFTDNIIDVNNEFFKYLPNILTNNLKLRPNRVIIITDGLCSSACAQFTVRLLEQRNAISIGFGGVLNSAEPFDAGAYIGGTVNDMM